MQRLLETIHCLDGECLHLSYHLKRISHSRRQLHYTSPFNLELTPPTSGEFRCRVVYDEIIHNIEYIPYTFTLARSFSCVTSNIEYALKYEDRSEINMLRAQHPHSDDIIIIKGGYVTDTSIANLCFFDGKQWITPRNPILKGTTRQRLLDEKKIIEGDVLEKELHTFSKIAVMNAMTGFQIIENAIIL